MNTTATTTTSTSRETAAEAAPRTARLARTVRFVGVPGNKYQGLDLPYGYPVEVHEVDGRQQLVYRHSRDGVYVCDDPRPGDIAAPAPHAPWCSREHDPADEDDSECRSGEPRDGEQAVEVGPGWRDPQGGEVRVWALSWLSSDPNEPTGDGVRLRLSGPVMPDGSIVLSSEDAYWVGQMLLEQSARFDHFDGGAATES